MPTAETEQEQGNMSALRKSNGDLEIVPPIPKPEGNPQGKIFDAHGLTVRPKPLSLMARLDERASEKIQLSRGTLWLVGTLLILAGVIFSYGSTFIAWARDDESQRVKMANVERQVEEMNRKIDEMGKALQEQRVQDAVKRGYELKAAEGAHK